MFGNKKFSPEVISEHNLREKAVIKFLTDTTGELTAGFRTFENGSYILPERANFILCFSLVDVMRKYWEIYNDCPSNETHQKPSFIKWSDDFCFTEENGTFKKNKMLKRLNSNSLYNLRCSLVHFYGLSPHAEGISFSIAPNEASDEWILNTSKKLSKEHKIYIILRSSDIHNLVYDGADVMLERMQKNIEFKPKFHMEAIERIYEKFRSEGVVGIDLKLEDIK